MANVEKTTKQINELLEGNNLEYSDYMVVERNGKNKKVLVQNFKKGIDDNLTSLNRTLNNLPQELILATEVASTLAVRKEEGLKVNADLTNSINSGSINNHKVWTNVLSLGKLDYSNSNGLISGIGGINGTKSLSLKTGVTINTSHFVEFSLDVPSSNYLATGLDVRLYLQIQNAIDKTSGQRIEVYGKKRDTQEKIAIDCTTTRTTNNSALTWENVLFEVKSVNRGMSVYTYDKIYIRYYFGTFTTNVNWSMPIWEVSLRYDSDRDTSMVSEDILNNKIDDIGEKLNINSVGNLFKESYLPYKELGSWVVNNNNQAIKITNEYSPYTLEFNLTDYGSYGYMIRNYSMSDNKSNPIFLSGRKIYKFSFSCTCNKFATLTYLIGMSNQSQFLCRQSEIMKANELYNFEIIFSKANQPDKEFCFNLTNIRDTNGTLNGACIFKLWNVKLEEMLINNVFTRLTDIRNENGYYLPDDVNDYPRFTINNGICYLYGKIKLGTLTTDKLRTVAIQLPGVIRPSFNIMSSATIYGKFYNSPFRVDVSINKYGNILLYADNTIISSLASGDLVMLDGINFPVCSQSLKFENGDYTTV